MNLRRLCTILVPLLLTVFSARAHIGSPDVFYEGQIGPYATQVTIRMPGVVPGKAVVSVTVETSEPVAVSFRPLYNRSAISNAPPPDAGILVPGETNRYSGELWLMSFGAYSIDIAINGKSGQGEVQIPVNSIASQQLPLPPYLGRILALLGMLLFAGGVAIVAAAASESTLAPGAVPTKRETRKWWRAATVSAVIFFLLLVGGKKWWNSDENDFRARLRDGGWPDLTGTVRVDGSQRILTLTLGEKDFEPNEPMALALDHGKLLHFFLVREPAHDAFAHIHPVRKGTHTFEVVVPPLPEGDYEMLCDLTLESGTSSTATNLVHIPAFEAQKGSIERTTNLVSDPDDSWASEVRVSLDSGGDTISRLADGKTMIWKSHPPLRVNQDARLKFEVRDSDGQPAALEPYMGMMSHVEVLRSDGCVFAHLHPSGNFSMAAQMVFDAKMQNELAGANAMPAGMDHSKMGHMMHHHMPGGSSTISVPYQFPTPGAYRLWVQVKSGGQILTGVYDAVVNN